jgi:YMGG-like Gly-zipper
MNRRFACLLALFALASLPLLAQFSTRPDNIGSPGPNYVDEGTRFMIQLTQNLDSNKLKAGQRFKARLAEDLVAPNGTLIPAGKTVRGHVSDVERGYHSQLLLSFDEIETTHGWRPLTASVSDVPGEHGVKPVGDEGQIEKAGPNKQRTIEEAATGAAVGASIGAISGGGKGAGIGAGAGAATGVAAGLLLNNNVKLLKGQQIELRLDRPLQVPQA